MDIIPLSTIERNQGGFTHKFVIREADLTQSVAATGQTLNLLALPVGTLIMDAALKLPTAFAQAGDAANNSLTVSLGDTGSATRYIAATQINGNGTPVPYKAWANAPLAYTTADTLQAAFSAPPAGKTLLALDSGEVHLFVELVNLLQL